MRSKKCNKICHISENQYRTDLNPGVEQKLLILGMNRLKIIKFMAGRWNIVSTLIFRFLSNLKFKIGQMLEKQPKRKIKVSYLQSNKSKEHVV